MKSLFSIVTMLVLGLSLSAQTETNDLAGLQSKMENGQILLEKSFFNLGIIYNTEIKTTNTVIYNNSDSAMTITFNQVPPFVKMTIEPNVLLPHTKGIITVEYSAKLNVNNEGKQNWGDQNQRVSMLVNGNQNQRNNFQIRATINEDYSKLTPKQLALAPKIEFTTPEFQFGTVNHGDVIDYEFEFTNTGKSDLEIRHIKTSCGCTAASSTLSSIKPGEKASIKASFNTKGKHGKQTKTITVTTNDPSQPNVAISMIGEVLDPPNVIKPIESPVNNNATPKN